MAGAQPQTNQRFVRHQRRVNSNGYVVLMFPYQEIYASGIHMSNILLVLINT